MAAKTCYVWRREGFRGLCSRFAKLNHRRYEADTFDCDHQTDTGGHIPLWKLAIPSADWEAGVGYGATSPAEFNQAMRLLQISPSDHTFIDLGSGKGRVLIMAGEYSFRRIIGIEFSPELCAIARKNLAITHTHAEVICQSAIDFEFPLEPSVIFMCNPFFAEVMKPVISHIYRNGFLVYVNPKLHDLIPFPLLHRETGVAVYQLSD
jgi:SAM-dependent methyltransferase